MKQVKMVLTKDGVDQGNVRGVLTGVTFDENGFTLVGMGWKNRFTYASGYSLEITASEATE